MANILILSRLINGVQREVNLSTNTLVVGALSTGSNTLTDTILGRLISLQNGSDIGTTFHTHDTVYTRTSALTSAASGTAGSTLIGDDNTYTHFTPGSQTVKGALSAIDAALGSATSALDGSFRIQNTTDTTKKIAFDASAIATGTTRTITMANANVNLSDVNNAVLVNGTRPFTADQSMGGFRLLNVAYPSSQSDAATMGYVLDKLDGRTWKNAARAGTTANISLVGLQTIDGVVLVAGDRVLVKNQTIASQNGIYAAAAAGWARTTDFDNSPVGEIIDGASLIVGEGTTLQGTEWTVQNLNSPFTVGTDPIPFVQTSGPGSYTAGNGISITGAVIAAVLDAVGGLDFNGSAIRIKAGGVVLTTMVSGVLPIANGGTNSSSALNNGRIIISAAGKIVETTALTPSRVVVSDASGLPISSPTSSTEVGFLTGTTSNVQGQINGKQSVGAAQVLNELAGETLAATTLVALRYALSTDSSFSAGTVRKADYDTTTTDNFNAIGLAYPGTSVSSGAAVTVVTSGLINVPSHGFTVGTPVYLGASGAIVGTAPSTSLQAVVKLGMVKDANNIFVQTQVMGVN
jgi:hypothetical protein